MSLQNKLFDYSASSSPPESNILDKKNNDSVSDNTPG